MEFVKGVTLGEYVAKHGALAIPKACDYIRQVAAALEHAHRRGHIHGDIKPQNLMLTPEDRVKVLDFGLARVVTESWAKEAPVSGRLTSRLLTADSLTAISSPAGMILGTPDFMAPEQVLEPLQGDPRSDLYSLGCTFYYLLTGQVPFPGGSVLDKLRAHRDQTPKPISDCRTDAPSEVVAILNRMMAKRPEDRYRFAGDVVDAFRTPVNTLFSSVLMEDRGLRWWMSKVGGIFHG